MLSRIQMPQSAKRGDVIEIRIAIQHPMETGYRHDELGRAIPANVVNRMLVRYGGDEIFRAEMGTGIAANPYLAFFTIAQASGEVEFSWVDDTGETGFAKQTLTVEG
jgi:sulfur-oxidizing protein SoxZ